MTAGFGDPVYLGPGHDEIDHLYITCHDGGDTEIFEDSVDEFVRKLRNQPVGVGYGDKHLMRKRRLDS